LSEQHTPYYSTRARIADVTTVALTKNIDLPVKERTIEVVLGNTKEMILARDPTDIAKVTDSKDIKGLLLDAFKQTDEVATARKFTFLDQVKKNE